MAPTTEILLRDGRFIRRSYAEQDLGTQESLIGRLSGSRCVPMLGALNFGNNKRIHLFCRPDSVLAFVELDSLPFNSCFTAASCMYRNTVVMSPTYVAVPRQGDISFRESFPWPKALLGLLYFAVKLVPNGNTSGGYRAAECLLVAKGSDGEFFAPPYPNIFESGKICMGRDWENNPSGGFYDIPGIFVYCYNHFHGTALNGDLTTGLTSMLFSRSIEDGSWLAPSLSEGMRADIRTVRHITSATFTGITL